MLMSKWNTSLSLWFREAILKIMKRPHVCFIFFDITCLQKSQKILYVRKDAMNWASLMNIYAPINKSRNLSKQIKKREIWNAVFFICALCFPESDGRFISIFLSFIKGLSLSGKSKPRQIFKKSITFSF